MSEGSEIRFTEAQREAIAARERGILVSAAAGSGKTATLTERIVRLIVGDGATVDQFLVLTFTENAAAEMRQRIQRRLAEMARTSPSEHVTRQALLVDRMGISTIHGFCARVLRQHAAMLGIDPGFAILSEEDAGLMRRQVAERVLAGAYGDATLPGFADLLAMYAADEEAKLRDVVLGLDRFLSSLPDAEGWRREALGRLEEAVERPGSSLMRREMLRLARERLDGLVYQCKALMDRSDQIPTLAGYVQKHLLPRLEGWRKDLANVPEDAGQGPLWSFAEVKKLPNIQNDKGIDKSLKDEGSKLKAAVMEGPMPEGLMELGDPERWKGAFEPVLPAMQALVELSRRFAAEMAADKRAAGVLDFADLEHLTLRLLERDGGPTELARELTRRYPHILIDECQDISPIQDRLLSLLSGEVGGGGGRASLFTVGDLKQSIYRFRLAAPELFQKRQEVYTRSGGSARVILLPENFRSRGPLLKAVNDLFGRLMVGGRTEIDYAEGHELVAGAKYPASETALVGAPLEMHILQPPPPAGSKPDAGDGEMEAEEPENRGGDDAGEDGDDETEEENLERFEREADFIALRIKQLLGLSPGGDGRVTAVQVADRSAAGGVRAARFGDIAVLLRAATVKSGQASAMLRRRGIPVRMDARGGLLEIQEVQDVLAVLRLLEDPTAEIALLTYFRSPLSGVEEADAALAWARARHPEMRLHEAMVAEAATEPGGAIRAGLERLVPWRELASRRGVGEVVHRILADTLYVQYVMGRPDGALRRAALDELQRRADAFSAGAGGVAGAGDTVGAFVAYLRAADEDESKLDQPTPPARTDDAVAVMTIHKSKGLEFPIVVVPDLGRQFNLKDLSGSLLYGREELLAPMAVDRTLKRLYPSPATAVAKGVRRPRLLAEELRVLYVALTRAREHVILVGTVPGRKASDPVAKAASRATLAAGRDRLLEEAVLACGNAMEWLLLANCHARQAGVTPIDVTLWTHESLMELTKRSGIEGQPKVPPEVLALKALSGVSDAQRAAAERLGERVTSRYAHGEAAFRRAAVSVTSVTHDRVPPPAASPAPKAEGDAVAEKDPHPGAAWPIARKLSGQSEQLAATERGTATHIALEHFDFRKPTTDAEVLAHLEDLRRRRLLTDLEVGSVEVGAFRFLAESELGPLLRGERGRLHAELPIYLPGETGEGLDREMIRGRIDLLVATAEGPVIIDYKTDHVWGKRLAERIEQYRVQVELYRRAAQAITGRPAAGVYLAFVHERARRIVRFGGELGGGIGAEGQ